MKEDWADNHAEFVAETEDDPGYLLVYSDGSLTERQGRRLTGHGTVGYTCGKEVFRRGEALGEHVEVYDAEMAGLRAAAEEVKRSGAFDKTTPTKANAQEETGSMREEERELSPERDDETRRDI